jgi:hypothetical protein
MTLRAIRIGALRMGLLALSGLALALSAGSCGKVKEGGQPLYDSNTNWLTPCMVDDQCSGSLRCYCGQCTKPCAQDAECMLLSDAQCAESSESLCGESPSAGGLCVKGCSTDTDCGDRFSCEAAQCVPQPCSAGQCTPRQCDVSLSRTWDEVILNVNDDLSTVDVQDRFFQRYFALGNESEESDPGTGVCEASLQRKRQALTKLLNSLSIEPNIQEPLAIDADLRLYRIDLRDYQWDRQVRVGAPEYADVWEALIASDPYALPFIGADAEDMVADTNTSVPVLLVDSFIATATRPELYSSILELPGSLDVLLEAELGIAPGTPPTVQAGFIDEAEFLAQRWDMGVRNGFVWSIADYGRPPGALFADPLQPPLGERELTFTLPNGLLAFAFANEVNALEDSWRVTRDPRETDRVARAPRSNWRRHPGTLAVRDQVRGYVDLNENLYPQTLSAIQESFPGAAALSEALEQDAAFLTRRALQLANLDPFQPDPITRVTEDFDAPLTLESAAALLLVTPDDLLANLSLLDPALEPLAVGTVPRSVFTASYASSMCTLSLVLENQPEPGYC